MAVQESIQVRCSRCRGKFREKARRIREGYSRQCPSCERMLFFIENSPIKDVADAMREAERVRKLLRQEEDEKVSQRPAAMAVEDTDPFGDTPSMPRQIDRRVRTSGRVSSRSR